MPTATASTTAPFRFEPGTLVHVLGPHQPVSRPDLMGARGTDAYTGRTMEVVEHYSNGDVDLTSEGNDRAEVSIHETRLIAD